VRKLKFLLPAFAVIGMFFFVSCKKTTNNTTEVKDSIYYSAWAPISMTFDNTDSVYYEDFNNSAITASVINSGAVICYYGYPNSAGDTVALDASTIAAYLGAQIALSVGQLEITVPYGNDLTYSASSGYLFRYVIIPGNVLTGSSLKNLTQQQLSHMSFTDVTKALNNPVQGTSSGTQPRF
jgi:hypothetical protein